MLTAGSCELATYVSCGLNQKWFNKCPTKPKSTSLATKWWINWARINTQCESLRKSIECSKLTPTLKLVNKQ
jgi:hypothetical protein